MTKAEVAFKHAMNLWQQQCREAERVGAGQRKPSRPVWTDFEIKFGDE